MDKLYIKGGNKLNGELAVPSAKNSVLPILAGTILCDGVIKINNFPNFQDTLNMNTILKWLGGKISIANNTLTADMTALNKFEIPSALSEQTRSSFFCLGAILGRFKKAKVAYPGGCDIGTRPIDLHLKGLEKLNVKITDKHGHITCDGSNMRGATIHLDFPSVGATENLMMAAALTKGETKIINCAKEPEIEDLQNFLVSAGASIKGAGTSEIIIKGVKKLTSTHHTPITDRIITGTYMLACAMCGGKIRLKTQNAKHLQALISKIKNNTCKIICSRDIIEVEANPPHKSNLKIQTMPYPGFATDLQSQTLAYLSTCRGTSIMVENLFETRYKCVTELTKMGAKITTKDRLAIVKGVKNLYGAEVTATDLRGGASLVLAGLIAQGFTTISGINHIERGYQNIEQHLSQLGADIKKIKG